MPTKHLILRVVTRGTNPEAVARTCAALLSLDLDPETHVIQVVSDEPVLCPEEVKNIVVPHGFKPPGGAKWKARALHYAARSRFTPQGSWVLHLDEESVPTIECITGCWTFMERYPERIGQGEILYTGQGYDPASATCAADALRTGDDLLRFRFQYALGVPIFGVHGSFLLVPGGVERAWGWDVGAGGSVTEDAAFAMNAWANKVRFGWVDGQVIEQSPYTLPDFLKQRRRWWSGLWVVVLEDRFPAWNRIILATAMTAWTISPVLFFVYVVSWVFGVALPLPLVWLGRGLFVYYGFAYALGGWRSGGIKPALWAVVRMPLSFVYESAGVVYGMVKPVVTFEVVNKN